MATKKAATKKTATPKKAAPGKAGGFRAKVRMYRQGLGDCFLITLPQKSGNPFYVLIDCGVILGTADPSTIMTKVVEDIVTVTGGHIGLLAATHEHWDHLSGFIQAQDSFKKLTVDEVWLAWTEDPKDKLANQLRGERAAMRVALTMAEARMRFGGAEGGNAAADEVRSMLEFFGAAGDNTTGAALDFVHKMSSKVRFCLPSDAPREIGGTGTQAYVLGPPHDEAAIKKFDPSKAHPETYGMDSMNLFMSSLSPVLMADEDDDGAPFDPQFAIPLEAAKQVPFFQDHYWGEDANSDEKDQSWRSIDCAWLDSSSTFALQLDSATNNTSLVLAFELPDGDVLLFAADAQVGNWLSWQDLTWKLDGGKTASGPGLLNKAIVYKVGHHGSHNATLREKGLEMMANLQTAFIPVNHDMALKKRWGNMPLTELLTALDEKTKNRVLRVDQPMPPALSKEVVETDLYFELTV